MSNRTLVTLVSPDPALADLKPGQRVFGTVWRPEDAGVHPYGQWSVVLERTGAEGVPGLGLFWVTPVAEGAPPDLLNAGELLLYRGSVRLAALSTFGRGNIMLDRDRDLLPAGPARIQPKAAA